MKGLSPIVWLLFLVLQNLAQASVYVMMSDGDLADQAKLIIVGTVLDRRTGFSTRAVTRYHVRVEEVVKGDLPTRVVEVDVPGGRTISGMDLAVYAVPEFEIGDRTILCLMPNRYGTYGILQLMLGAFREVRIAGSRLAVRDLREAREMFRSPQSSRFGQPRSSCQEVCKRHQAAFSSDTSLTGTPFTYLAPW